MQELLDQIKDIELKTGSNFSYNLDKELEIISSYLKTDEQQLLKQDFDRFFEKGRFIVLNTFGGGILFLKVPERIEKIKIESDSKSKGIIASVVFESKTRRPENIKYKPKAGKTESIKWSVESIFPNFYNYHKTIQSALMLVIGKIVKQICEYGMINFYYMRIENEFNIDLLLDGQLESKLNVKIN